MNTQLVSDLGKGSIVRVEIMVFDWVATRIISSFTNAFGSLSSQNPELIWRSADGNEAARKVVEAIVEFDSFNGQWPSGLEFCDNSVTLRSWGQNRELKVESLEVGGYKITINCSDSPSHTALTGVRETLISLLSGDEKFDLSVTLKVEAEIRTYTVERRPQFKTAD